MTTPPPYIASFLASSDSESRYMGLHLLSLKVDTNQYLEYAQEIVKSMISEYDVLVKTQVMWLACKLLNKGLLNPYALAIASQEFLSSNAFLRMWALELYATLVQNKVPVNEITDVLEKARQDNDLFVKTEALFLHNSVKHSHESVPTIVENVKNALQLTTVESQHFGLYFLSKLVDTGHTFEYAYQAVLKALHQTDKIKIQALWVLSRLVYQKQNLDEALNIIQSDMHSPHWRIRFGSLIVLDALMHQEPKNKQSLIVLLDKYKDDSNEYIQTYLAFLQDDVGT